MGLKQGRGEQERVGILGLRRWEFHRDAFEITLPEDRTKGGLGDEQVSGSGFQLPSS